MAGRPAWVVRHRGRRTRTLPRTLQRACGRPGAAGLFRQKGGSGDGHQEDSHSRPGQTKIILPGVTTTITWKRGR